MSNPPVSDPLPPASAFVQLLSLASHELRTPASVVGGYLRMLQKDNAGLSERQRKMIDEAAKSCARMVALIGELSEVGKLEGNTAQVKTEAFDSFSDLPGVAGQVDDVADRDVQLRVTGLGSGAPLEGDRERLLAAFGAFFHALMREQPGSTTIVADRHTSPTPAARLPSSSLRGNRMSSVHSAQSRSRSTSIAVVSASVCPLAGASSSARGDASGRRCRPIPPIQACAAR
ncbi:MAG: histidine kinase dimerization/phospho-acceptor domain-containing protein [Vicinamibacterales bacterium]